MKAHSFGALFIALNLPFDQQQSSDTYFNNTFIRDAAYLAKTSFFKVTDEQQTTLTWAGAKPSPLSENLHLDPSRIDAINAWQTEFCELVSDCDTGKPITLGQLYACYQKTVNQAFLAQNTAHLDLLSGVISVMRHLPVPFSKKKSDTDPIGHILSDLCASYFLEKSIEYPKMITSTILSRVFYEKAQAIWHMLTNYRGCVKSSGDGYFVYTMNTGEKISNESDRTLWYDLKDTSPIQKYRQPLNFKDLTKQAILYLSSSITLTPSDLRSRFRLMEILFGAPFARQKKKNRPLYLNYYLNETLFLERLKHQYEIVPPTHTLKTLIMRYEQCKEYAYITSCVRAPVLKTTHLILQRDNNPSPLTNDQDLQNDAFHP